MTTATVDRAFKAQARNLQPAAAGKNTKLGRAQRAIELERLEKERVAEANKAQQFSASHKYVMLALLILTGLAAAMTFATSFVGLFGASAWALGDASPILRSAIPLTFDIAVLAFTIKLFVDRERGDRVFWTWLWIGVLAAVSSGSNVLHAQSVTTAKTLPQLISGMVFAGAAPFLLALVTEVAGKLVFAKPAEPSR